VLFRCESEIVCLLTTTLRLELARAATSARHVVCVIWVFVCEVRGRRSSCRCVCWCGVGIEESWIFCLRRREVFSRLEACVISENKSTSRGARQFQ
jgi:hypothetical protein